MTPAGHPPPRPAQPRLSRAGQWSLSVAITAVYTGVLIAQSLVRGNLSMPVTYDDVSYDLESAGYLVQFYDHGWRGLLRMFVLAPPHAPISTFLGLIGFSLFGIHEWAATAANSLAVFVFVRIFLGLAAGLQPIQGVMLAFALLSAPLMQETLLWVRPDMICALIMASGMLWIVLRPDFVTSRLSQVIAGVILAAALWAKPTVFHLSLLLFAVAGLLASLDALRRRQWRAVLLAASRLLATAALLSLPYWWVGGRAIITYIRTTLGPQAGIWVKHVPVGESLLFYLTGWIGGISLGPWLYGGLAIFGLAFAVLAVKRDRAGLRQACIAAALLVATYLSVTIPTFKGPHGMVFAAVFVCLVALSCLAVMHRLPRSPRWAFASAVLLFALWQFGWYSGFTRAPGETYDDALHQRQSASAQNQLRSLYETCGADTAGRFLVQTAQSTYINTSTLSFEYRKHWQIPPDSLADDNTPDLAVLKADFARADYILTLTPEATQIAAGFALSTPENRAMVMKMVDASGDFDPAVRIPFFENAGAALLYKAKPYFGTFGQEQGLGPIEPAQAVFDFPAMRKSQGDHSTVVATGKPDGAARLFMIVRTPGLSGEVVTTLVNGKPAGDFTVDPAVFQAVDIPVTFDGHGRAEIRMNYAIAGPYVWFKALAVR